MPSPDLSPSVSLGGIREDDFLRIATARQTFAETDWAAGPMGSVSEWPSTLSTLVDLMLNSSHAMFIAWGEARTLIYNDAYANILAQRHPSAMGASLQDVWSEVWDEVEPFVAQTFAGDAVRIDHIRLVLDRNGTSAPAHFSFSYTPVRIAGEVAGLFCACRDTTEVVLETERTALRADLGKILRVNGDQDEILKAAAKLVGSHLRVNAIGFCESDATGAIVQISHQWTDGTIGEIASWQRLDDYGEEISATLRSGQVIRIEDRDQIAGKVEGLQRIDGMRAALVVPIVWGGKVVGMTYALNALPRKWTDQEVGILDEVTERTWTFGQHAKANQASRRAEVRFRTITEAMPQMVWSTDADGTPTFLNARWYEFTGAEPGNLEEQQIERYIHPHDRDAVQTAWAAAKSHGTQFEQEARLLRHDGQYRWCLLRAVPKLCPEEGLGRWMGTSTDIHEIKEVQRHRTLLVSELDHRVKNTLAVVQSIAHQTFRQVISDNIALEAFQKRLAALARTHDILTRASWAKALLTELIVAVFEGCGAPPERYLLSGIQIVLPPKASVSLSMALHELCTNAVKYGALSTDRGRVQVSWVTYGERRFRFLWKECGGPTVSVPDRHGFGTQMIRHVVASEFNGTAELRFEARGFRCHIDATLPIVPDSDPLMLAT